MGLLLIAKVIFFIIRCPGGVKAAKGPIDAPPIMTRRNPPMMTKPMTTRSGLNSPDMFSRVGGGMKNAIMDRGGVVLPATRNAF
jgi:hypothetical protein